MDIHYRHSHILKNMRMIKVLWNHFAENNLILAVSIICIGETYANLFFDEV